MRKLISLLTSRITFLGLIFLAQIILVATLILEFANQWYYISIISTALSFLITIYIMADEENPMFKLTWIIIILVFPLFGVILYSYSRTEKLSHSKSTLMNEMQERRMRELKKVESIYHDNYLRHQKFLTGLHFPSYENTISKFLPNGQVKQEELLKALKSAKEYIFMEYFIITKSKMWDEILQILKEKQKEGVEIRIIYDDLGSATKLPFHYHKTLEKLGFKVVRFNPMRLRVKFSMNYRDHRKIVVIDNKIAFTGGFNIGDEYTNKKKVFGYWNDAGIMLEGEAVWSLTVLFLENWAFSKKEKMEFRKYYREYKVQNNALYIPFGDIPTDKNYTARSIYLQLINDAKEKIYITAPYFILDNEINTALKMAAQSGVEVKIVIPNIPDKKLVYMVSESYVSELIPYGVKIYKFTPGFIHSKMIIADDRVAMIGTSNLDFRSLYMHLENNVWFDDLTTIEDMVKYYDKTVQNSKLITAHMLRKRNFIYRALQALLRGFSALL
ncbi:cardiolipin synthase [Acholeplasma hippikon]|uniref:Cardiolipin synthase n=1 Tax=Acholeplasma hippikon TaxID=264636 RepID=A0A449BKQ8_9MOLU|nr:cardiolipin synthase [Acholeplasma hippikon]VEU83014.1 Cardiolipin synthase [Acholeplasma hippikon]